MSIEDNKAFVRHFFKLIEAGDAEAIADSYDPEGQVHTMGSTIISGTRGMDEIRAFSGAVLDTFPKGLAYTIHTITAEGDNVAVECEAVGEHVSGQHYHQHYHFLFQFRNGKLLHLKEYLDTELVTKVFGAAQ